MEKEAPLINQLILPEINEEGTILRWCSPLDIHNRVAPLLHPAIMLLPYLKENYQDPCLLVYNEGTAENPSWEVIREHLNQRSLWGHTAMAEQHGKSNVIFVRRYETMALEAGRERLVCAKGAARFSRDFMVDVVTPLLPLMDLIIQRSAEYEHNAVFGYNLPKECSDIEIQTRKIEAGRFAFEKRPTKSIAFKKLLVCYKESPDNFGDGLRTLLAHFAAEPNGAERFRKMLETAEWEKKRVEDEYEDYCEMLNERY
ncbi:hypothetical protein LJC49_06320 [Ruminococcaceae bacterium OttesenSCG-928-I18]|nr:hypothetical protein [Ruminococcaceae bacterium OttesenSCG-928-I18]